MVTQFMDLFNDPFFIGFNRDLARLNNIHREAIHESYPPYDVFQHDDDEYVVTLAVAGFGKEDISVQVDNGTLVVKGERKDLTEDAPKHVVHKGIAARKFTRTFALGEYMEVTSASLENGLLNVFVERIVPEEKKPKTIKIK
jgi:molecular chaperone IbpA